MASPAITHNSNHVAEGLAHRTAQFIEKPRYAAMLTSWLEQVQEIEDVLWDLLMLRALDNPFTVGAQLDMIGNIVGQAREGLDDAIYVRFLGARIKANSSDARLETLFQILLLILGDATTIRARDFVPKAVEIEVDAVGVSAWMIFNEFLGLAKAPGDNLTFIYSKAPATGTLKFTSSHSALTMTPTQRFGSSRTVGVGGGVLAGEFGGQSV